MPELTCLSLSKEFHDKLIKKRNERGLFLFSNGIFLLVGVLSSIDFSLLQLKIASWVAIAASLSLIAAGCYAFVHYHFLARKFT
jgi:hypothetical protein